MRDLRCINGLDDIYTLLGVFHISLIDRATFLYRLADNALGPKVAEMTEYKDSDWTDGVFVDKFLDAVYLKVPQRQRMFELAASYYRHFLSDRTGNVILDLGCGDGILTKELLEVDGTISAILVDASSDMLRNARTKLAAYDRIR